jgi:parallel beta helix pectate lyase-like protein
MTRYMKLYIVLVLLACPGFAANLYVDSSNDCKGSKPCFTSIQAAVEASNPGDSIIVMPGYYRECVQINHPLRLRAFDLQPMVPLHQTREWSRILAGEANTHCPAITIASTTDVVIEGFFLEGGDDLVVRDSQRIVVRDNMISSSDVGYSEGYGVLLFGTVSDSEVRDNYFFCGNTSWPGITIWGNACPAPRSGGNTISQNMGFHACSPAIWVLNSDANTLANNSILGGYKPGLPNAGIWLMNASANIVLHNDINSLPGAQNPMSNMNYAVYIDSNCGESASNLLQVNNLVETLPANPQLSEGIHLQPGASGTILRNNVISNWTVPLSDLGSDTLIIGQR